MRITKYTHACVRVEDGDRLLVVDPGIWSEGEVFEGINDILVTHEHVDHVDTERLVAAATANSSLVVHAPAPVAEALVAAGVPALVAGPGDVLSVGGFEVVVTGGLHAEIYDGLPGCANVGYVIDGRVYHPGDSFSVPDSEIDVLLVPTSGPWFSVAQGLDFVRAVAPRTAVSIHDALLSDKGMAITDRWFDLKAETQYRRLEVGDAVDTVG